MAGGGSETSVVVAFREEGRWSLGLLPERLGDDLDGLVAALRQQPGEGGVLGLVNVADEFFVALRVTGQDVRLLLSDVTAAVAWDLAAQVLEHLDVPVPGDDDDLVDVWPAGDMSIFADLGIDEMELGAVLEDDAYADEMLLLIARRLGFAAPYERVIDAAVR